MSDALTPTPSMGTSSAGEASDAGAEYEAVETEPPWAEPVSSVWIDPPTPVLEAARLPRRFLGADCAGSFGASLFEGSVVSPDAPCPGFATPVTGFSVCGSALGPVVARREA